MLAKEKLKAATIREGRSFKRKLDDITEPDNDSEHFESTIKRRNVEKGSENAEGTKAPELPSNQWRTRVLFHSVSFLSNFFQ